MPSEETLRENPFEQYAVNESVVWYDDSTEMFCAADAESGDAGDAFATYDELVLSV